jgi:hypothetical protein
LLSDDEEVLAGAEGAGAGAAFAPSPLSEEEVESLEPVEGEAEGVEGGAFLLLL